MSRQIFMERCPKCGKEKMLITKVEEDWWNERKAVLIALQDEWQTRSKDN